MTDSGHGTQLRVGWPAFPIFVDVGQDDVNQRFFFSREVFPFPEGGIRFELVRVFLERENLQRANGLVDRFLPIR